MFKNVKQSNIHNNENSYSVTGSGYVVQAKSEKVLIKGIIYLTSEKLFTFASVIAALWSWWGVCIDDTFTIAFGAMLWLVAFTPWALRKTARDIRQDRLGLKQW